MDSLLLATGLGMEVTRHEAIKCGVGLVTRLEAALDAYDAKHPIVVSCSGDIMCQREGRRHKRDCIGKDVPFSQYVRELA